MRKMMMIAALCAAAALTGCGTTKARSFDARGMYVSDTGQLAVGSVHADAIPDGLDSSVIHYSEDTALLSPSTKTHKIDIVITGTNAVTSASGIVDSICKAFIAVAPQAADANARAPSGKTAFDLAEANAAARADAKTAPDLPAAPSDADGCANGACSD